MQKKPKKADFQSKAIKLDSQTHKLLRMYAAEKDLRLGQAVRYLLDKFTKKEYNHKIFK